MLVTLPFHHLIIFIFIHHGVFSASELNMYRKKVYQNQNQNIVLENQKDSYEYYHNYDNDDNHLEDDNNNNQYEDKPKQRRRIGTRI